MKNRIYLGGQKAVLLAVGLGLAALPGIAFAQTAPDSNAVPPTPPPLAALSGDASDVGAKLTRPAREVVQMSVAGVAPEVIKAYVDNAPAPFQLTSDNIIHLHGIGISGDVLAAMLNRDVALHDRAVMAAQGMQPPPNQPYYPANPQTNPQLQYPVTAQPQYPATTQPDPGYGALPADNGGGYSYDYGAYPYYPYYYPYYGYAGYPWWGYGGGWYWGGGRWNWRGGVGVRGGFGGRGFVGGGFHGGAVGHGGFSGGGHGGFSGGGHAGGGGGGGHR